MPLEEWALGVSAKDLIKQYLPHQLQLWVAYYAINQKRAVHRSNISGTIPVQSFNAADYGVSKTEDVPTPAGTLHIMHLYPENYNPQTTPVIVAHHGVKGHWFDCTRETNQEPFDTEFRIKALQCYRLAGYHVIAYSAPGFGKSTGTPGAKAYKVAAEAFSDHIAGELAGKNVTIFGESMGASQALMLTENLVARHAIHPKVVSLVAPFDTVQNVVKETQFPHLPAGALNGYWYAQVDNLRKLELLAKAEIPLHVVTLGKDTTVPNPLSNNLINAAQACGIKVTHQHLPGECHVGWDATPIVAKSQQAAAEVQAVMAPLPANGWRGKIAAEREAKNVNVKALSKL